MSRVRFKIELPPFPGKKRCPGCQEFKPFADFAMEKSRISGLSAYCRICCNAKGVERYRKSEEERARSAHRARSRNYGMTALEFAELLQRQVGLCAGCDAPLGPAAGQLHVDHCHTTGRIRGLLCRGCNQAIGHAKESPEVLRRLAIYLEIDRSDLS